MNVWWKSIVDRGMRRTNGRWASLSVMVFLVFIFWVLPTVSQYSAQIGLTESIDTSFGLSADRLWAIAAGYGEALRQAYLIQRWTFDLVFPLVYGGFLWISGLYLFKRIKGKAGLNWILAIIPLGVLFDYMENSLVSLVFLTVPQRLPGLCELAVIMIPVKWFFVMSSMVLVSGLGVWALVRLLVKR